MLILIYILVETCICTCTLTSLKNAFHSLTLISPACSPRHIVVAAITPLHDISLQPPLDTTSFSPHLLFTTVFSSTALPAPLLSTNICTLMQVVAKCLLNQVTLDFLLIFSHVSIYDYFFRGSMYSTSSSTPLKRSGRKMA